MTKVIAAAQRRRVRYAQRPAEGDAADRTNDKDSKTMLSSAQQSIIQTTVPALRQHGEAITEAMYATLFQAHPELNAVFNPVNQKTGRQARSLAASILSYAAHIESLDQLGGMVDQISHKHGSLEVRPEHYPIVGQHLLQAIRTVLGAAATEQVIDAWAAAYGQLAEIMIAREETLLAEGAAQPGGWRGYKPLRVVGKTLESETTISLSLADPDAGVPLPRFRPGQYVGVKVRVPGASYDQIRQYSVSNAPDGALYRIGVKRDNTADAPPGLISNFLHDHVAVGDELLTHVPLGEFVLDETSGRPVVLLSGGSGITAALSLLHALAKRTDHPEVVFVHATTCRGHHAFAAEVRHLAQQHSNIKIVVYYEQVGPADTRGADYEELGRLSLATLAPYLPTGDADYYYCGPIGFMNAVGAILDERGVSLARRHSEAFAPDPSFETKIDTR